MDCAIYTLLNKISLPQKNTDFVIYCNSPLVPSSIYYSKEPLPLRNGNYTVIVHRKTGKKNSPLARRIQYNRTLPPPKNHVPSLRRKLRLVRTVLERSDAHGVTLLPLDRQVERLYPDLVPRVLLQVPQNVHRRCARCDLKIK